MTQVSDDTDNVPFDPHHPRIDRSIGGPIIQEDQNSCFLDGKYYSEGSILLVDGRPATCQGGKWIGEGDDPPRSPRGDLFSGELKPDA